MFGVVVSVYISVVGMTVPMSLNASCWSSVGLVSISKAGMSVWWGMQTWLRVRVARWSSSVSKLWAGLPVVVVRVEALC